MVRKEVKVYMSEVEHKQLKKYCVDVNLSMSNFVNIAIREKISREMKKDKNRNLIER